MTYPNPSYFKSIKSDHALFANFWPMFENWSAANLALRHWKKQFGKLHHSLSDLRSSSEISSSKTIVVNFDIVHNVRHLQNCSTDGRIISSLGSQVRNWSECFVNSSLRFNMWHNLITMRKSQHSKHNGQYFVFCEAISCQRYSIGNSVPNGTKFERLCFQINVAIPYFGRLATCIHHFTWMLLLDPD